MADQEKTSADAKKMLIEIFQDKNYQNADKGAVFIDDEWDELEAEESQDYFEPPVVPRSCNNGGDLHKVSNAFKDSVDQTLTSNLHDSQSLGSTVSLKTFNIEPPMEYEEIIQKLEADIRKHIRIQNQLKLHIESLQGKVDENEKEGMVKNKEFEDLVEGNKKLKQSLIDIDRRKEDEIKSLKEEHQSEIK